MKHRKLRILSILLTLVMVCNVCLTGAVFAEGGFEAPEAEIITADGDGGSGTEATPQPSLKPSQQPETTASPAPTAEPSAQPTEEPTPGPHEITVHVKGADTAAAIEDAVVVIYPEGSSPEGEGAVSAQHGGNGDYKVTGLHNGIYYIMANAPGYLELAEPKRVTLEGGSMISIREEIVLIKDTRVTYSGVVTDARQQPVANMGVSVAKDPESQNGICDQASDVTDEAGRFELVLDSSADYTFALSQYGKVYLSETLPQPVQTQDANYMLDGFYLTEVALLNENGSPAQMVGANYDPTGTRYFQVIVSGIPKEIQANAEATFTFLGTSQPCEITVPSQGQFFEKSVSVPDCSVQEGPVIIELEQIGLNIIVKDESGEAVKAIDYKVVNNDVVEGFPLIYENSIRSEDGIFHLRCLDASAKSIQLTVSAEGYAPVEKEIKLKAYGPLEDMEVVLKSGTVSLTVLDSKQVAQSNCTVETDYPGILVAKSGSAYTMTNVPVGVEFSICISKSGFETQVFHTLVTDDQKRELTCYLTTPTSSSFGKLSGTVVDEAGKPIQDVLVKLGELFDYTNQSGQYSFSQIPLGESYDITFAKEGFISASVEDGVTFATDDSAQTLDAVTLCGAVDITVKVVDESTQVPVSDALLTAGGAEKVFSYGNGTYVLSGVPKDIGQISVSAPNYYSKLAVDISSEQPTTVTLAVAQADNRPVVGYVRDKAGFPLPGAKVNMGNQSVLADAEGYFTFYCVPRDKTRATAEKMGYRSGDVSGINGYVEILLEPTKVANGRIDGLVVDDSDAAIGDAKVEVFYVDGRGREQTVFSEDTTSRGGFSIGSLQKGKTYLLRVSKKGYSTYEAGIKAQSDSVQYIRLAPAGTYTLMVIRADAQPVGGAECYVPELDRYFKTDEAGKVTIDGLVFDTEYSVHVDTAGYVPAVRTRIRTTETAPNLSGTVTLDAIQPDKATLTGTVTDKNTGAPIRGAIVKCNASAAEAVTDEKGYYSLPGLNKSTQLIAVSASKDGYTSQSEGVVLLNAQHNLNLTVECTTGTVSGVVLDYDGNPLPGIYVAIAGRNVMTMGDGSYRLDGVSVLDSSATVSYKKLGYITETQRVSLSKTKAEDKLPAVTLRKSCEAVVHLQDLKNGSVITNATVDLISTDDRTIKYRMSPFSDYYKCEEVPEGNYIVNIVASSYYTLNPAPTVSVPLDMPATFELNPRSTQPTSRPQGGGGGGGGGYIPSVTTPPQPTAGPTTPPIPTAVPEWQGFQDMGNPNLSWASAPVYELVEAGVIAKADNFRPDDNITREEFIKMLVEAFDFYLPDAESNFIDADEGDWYYKYVASAAQVGILNGYEDGSFGAGQQISRQDMAVLSYRAALLAGKDIPVLKDAEVFADQNQIGQYALEAVESMQRAGIINGMGDGTFAPQNNATRAQAAKIMYGLWTLPIL